MNKLARQSILLILILILICILGRVLNHSSYTVYIPIPNANPASDTFIIKDNEKGTGEMIFEEPTKGSNYLRIKARPNERGTIEAQIVNQKGEVVTELFYHVNRFGTIFDYSTGGFTGDSIVMICLTVFFLMESLLMFLAFRRAKGPDFYAYSTIHTSSFSLFLLLTGLLQLAATIRHIMDPMSFTMLGVYNLISSAGYNFMRITFPFILTFAIAMTVSNIALLRHERARFQNVLGILISILMVGGVLLAFVVFNADFSGSEREYHIFQRRHPAASSSGKSRQSYPLLERTAGEVWKYCHTHSLRRTGTERSDGGGRSHAPLPDFQKNSGRIYSPGKSITQHLSEYGIF